MSLLVVPWPHGLLESLHPQPGVLNLWITGLSETLIKTKVRPCLTVHLCTHMCAHTALHFFVCVVPGPPRGEPLIENIWRLPPMGDLIPQHWLPVPPGLLGAHPHHLATWGSQSSLSRGPHHPHTWRDFRGLGVVPAPASLGWLHGVARSRAVLALPARRAHTQLILGGRCLDNKYWERWRLRGPAHIWPGFALYESVPLSSALPLLSRNRASASGQRDLGTEEVKVPGRQGPAGGCTRPPRPPRPPHILHLLPGGLFPSFSLSRSLRGPGCSSPCDLAGRRLRGRWEML